MSTAMEHAIIFALYCGGACLLLCGVSEILKAIKD